MTDYNPKEYIDELKQKLDNVQRKLGEDIVKWHPFLSPKYGKFHRWWLRLWYRISPRSFIRATIKNRKGNKFFIKPAATWQGNTCTIDQEIVIDLTELGLAHLSKEEIDKMLCGYEYDGTLGLHEQKLNHTRKNIVNNTGFEDATEWEEKRE